jgi:hypothetical protein
MLKNCKKIFPARLTIILVDNIFYFTKKKLRL